MRKYSVILLVLILGGGLFAKALENPFKGEAGVFDEDIEVERKPSKWTAAGLSLLLPGARIHYLRQLAEGTISQLRRNTRGGATRGQRRPVLRGRAKIPQPR